jgi:hypothetical protein
MKTRFDGTFVNTNDLCRGMDSRKKVVCGVAATVIIWLVSLFYFNLFFYFFKVHNYTR